MHRVVWSDDALIHLVEIEAYISQFNVRASRNIVHRLATLGDSLTDFPHRGRPAADDVRELATVPPYVIGYEIGSDQVTILYVRHGRHGSPA